MASKICNKCKEKNNPTFLNCWKCGAKLLVPEGESVINLGGDIGFVGVFKNEAREELLRTFVAPSREAIVEYMERREWQVVDIRTIKETERLASGLPTTKNFISDQIKRCNRNLFVTNLVMIVVSIYIVLNYSQLDYFGISLCGLIGLGIWNLVKAWKRKQDAFRHPIAASLARFGPSRKI